MKQHIPNLSKYPDLEQQFRYKLALHTQGCADCSHSKIVEDFRRRVKMRLERDKLTRRA